MQPVALIFVLPLFACVASTTPPVSLLVDSPQFQAAVHKMTVRSVLNSINEKNRTFYFGSTLADPSAWPANAEWTSARFVDTWNLAVAENDCKWFSNEPSQGVFNLTACEGLRDFAFQRGVAFRGHNTLWHTGRPSWLVNNPFEFTVAQLNETIIPVAVQSVIEGLGKNLTSWDVVNEPCWPNYVIDRNGSSPILFPDSSFINTALHSADAARRKIGSSMKLLINDYNGAIFPWLTLKRGGDFPSQSKTDCALKTLSELQVSGVPIDGLGIQSHYSATPQGFPSKASAHLTMNMLKASIFGDILDVCLYSSNVSAYFSTAAVPIPLAVTWDDESWLNTVTGRGVRQGTLYDSLGNPKLAYFEVLARLINFAVGGLEPCATSSGTSACVL
ncbi:glycoside hydrolase superfamily [Mycena leptocephala]|nr:glycoside hydrolase superfamily [Mycena leptocephala]